MKELTLDDVKMVPPPTSLNREKVREWVDALRSGDFQQCGANLYEPDTGGGERYCCLGVLAVLNGWDRLPNTEQKGYFLGHEALGFTPGPQIGANIQCVSPGRHTQSVWWLNDAYKWSFDQIADLIERDWL